MELSVYLLLHHFYIFLKLTHICKTYGDSPIVYSPDSDLDLFLLDTHHINTFIGLFNVLYLFQSPRHKKKSTHFILKVALAMLSLPLVQRYRQSRFSIFSAHPLHSISQNRNLSRYLPTSPNKWLSKNLLLPGSSQTHACVRDGVFIICHSPGV